MSDKRAFITGSVAYGLPRPKSDIDLVVFVCDDDLKKLCKYADKTIEEKANGGDYGGVVLSCPVRFGKLNLLMVSDPVLYDEVWRKGTRRLKKRAEKRGVPITRQEAIEMFQSLRKKVKE